uniref:Uncharacterized protein n=1 Tax=Anopheles dirus TaxID=7168 RepID=A0A182NW53_9DIPT
EPSDLPCGRQKGSAPGSEFPARSSTRLPESIGGGIESQEAGQTLPVAVETCVRCGKVARGPGTSRSDDFHPNGLYAQLVIRVISQSHAPAAATNTHTNTHEHFGRFR